MVTGVRDEEISGAVDRHTSWARETKLSGRRGSAVPAWTISSISRHSGNRPRRGHLPNSLVSGVRDEEICGTVDRHTNTATKLIGSSRSAVHAKTKTSLARLSGSVPCRFHLPNPLDIDAHSLHVALPIYPSSTRETKLSGRRGSAVPAKTISSISRHSGDRPRRGHLPNSPVSGVRDE